MKRSIQNENIDVYGDDVEVDYRGYEVTVENFVRLLTGRLPESTPRSKRLLTDAGSNILIYMTGIVLSITFLINASFVMIHGVGKNDSSL